MSSSPLSSEILNKVTHEYNRLCFNAYLLNHDNNNNHNKATTTTTRPQSVRIQLKFSRQYVPDNIDLSQISHTDGVGSGLTLYHSNYPLHLFDSAEDARPIFAAMVSNFETRLGVSTEQLCWGGYGDDEGSSDRLRGLGEAVDRLSQAATSIVHDALATGNTNNNDNNNNASESLTIVVWIFWRTVVEAERYREIKLLFPEEDDDDGSELATTAEFFEMAQCHGGDEELECAICLTEVLSGTRVARLPCAHRFHVKCIVPWLEKSKTCPLCRFSVGHEKT